MIPFIRVHPIEIYGSLQLQPFGLLVGTGVLAGAWLCKRRAKQAGIPEKEIQDAIFWAVVPGFLMAHWWSGVSVPPRLAQYEGLGRGP